MRERQIPNFEELKILIVSPYSMEPTGGVQKNIQGFGRFCLRNGHIPDVVYPLNQGFDNPTEVDHARTVHYLSETSMQTHNGTVAHTAKRIPANPAYVWQTIKRADPDIIHGHDPYASAPAVQLILQSRLPLLNARRIYNFETFHAAHMEAYDLEEPLTEKEKANKAKNRKFYERVSKVKYILDPLIDGTIVVSPVTKEFADILYPRKHNLIPNGVETSVYSEETETIERFADGKMNILYVGRLEGRKGVQYLAEAFAKLKRENENIRLIVVGDGPLKEKLQNLKENDGIGDLELVGRVSDEDLPKYYKTADICVFPATHGEAQGLVLIEAMAAGKAVIVGNNRGYSSVISHGENGLITDSANVTELTSQLDLLIKNETYRQQLAAEGQFESQKYDWDTVGPQIIDLYKKIILEKTA